MDLRPTNYDSCVGGYVCCLVKLRARRITVGQLEATTTSKYGSTEVLYPVRSDGDVVSLCGEVNIGLGAEQGLAGHAGFCTRANSCQSGKHQDAIRPQSSTHTCSTRLGRRSL